MSSPLRLLSLLCLLLVLPAPARAEPGDAIADLLEQAKEYQKRHEYRAAWTLYEEVLEQHPPDFKAWMGIGACAAALGEYPTAIRHFEAASKLRPEKPNPEGSRGYLALRLDRHEEAREWFSKAIAKGAEYAPALAGLARVEIEARDFEAADDLLRRAEKSEPEKDSVLHARAEYFFRSGDISSSARLLRLIRKKYPYDLGSILRLANGFLETRRAPYRRPAGDPAYEVRIAGARDLYRERRLLEARARLEELAGDPPDGRPLFYLGLIELRTGRTLRAIDLLRGAVELEPADCLYLNALGVAYVRRIDEQRALYGGGDGVDRTAPVLAALPRPEVPGVGKVVRGYERLLPEERAAIDRAVAPLARHLPALEKAGITHDILDFDEGMCDAPERAWLWTRRTIDGRWYGGLRGVGGKNAATGLEAILEAAHLQQDTFAHEFAHQVHHYAFSKPEQRVLTKLYEEAKAADLCLDYYAAENVNEYFAQGYEAFTSLVKSPYLPGLHRHTRAELLARDPALYRFIVRMTRTPENDPAVLAVAKPGLALYEWAGDELALERFRDLLAPLLSPEPR